MRSTPLLIEATPTEGCAVHVRFEDSTSADVDLSYLLDYGGIFEPLRDPEYFRRLTADPDAGTIVWPNEADIAPETLYTHARRRAGEAA
jgi:Protein of unknown function (DUF2442)